MWIIWRIAKITFNYKWTLFLSYLSILGVTVFAMLVPMLLGDAIDSVMTSGERDRLIYLSVAILVLSVGRGIAAYGQQYLGEAIGQEVAYDLRNQFYDHLQRLSFAFHDREQTGNLMSKATADVEGIRMFVQAGLVRAVQMIALFIGVGIAMFLLSWELALLSMLLAPLVVWRGGKITIDLRRQWFHVQTEMGHMTTVLQESLAGQKVVKAFAAEDYERDKFSFRAGKVSDHSYNAAVLQAANTAMFTIYHIGIMVVILWAGGREVIAGTLSEGQLAQFIFYLGLLTQPVRMSSFVINSYSRGLSAGQRLFDTLDVMSPVQQKPDPVELTRVSGHVEFKNVVFGYGAGSPVLKGINLEAKPTQVIAVVGAPGSGKSTLIHLIPRFYDVTGGQITIDGVDVRDVSLASLRNNIGIVQQDVFMFTTSIRGNIAYGNVDASPDEIESAAKIAQLHNFVVTLPDGYETWVGERGATLSGGQRQRLSIARTMLLDPPILILDDSTSSVDTETEHLIRLALQEVMKGRTTFVIAHRLSTVKNADMILVLRDGEIVQQGTHEELVNQPGPYQGIYELQLRPQDADAVMTSNLASQLQSRGNETESREQSLPTGEQA